VFGSAEGAISFATLLREDWPPPPPVEFDPATTVVALPYSSGTTGLPKGVMLTHTNLLAQLALIDGRPDTVTPRAGDVLLAFLPFFHIYGIVTFLNQALVRGATVISIPRFDLAQYLELVQRYRVSYLHLVPPVVLALAKHPLVDQYDVSSVRWGISAAAPLSAQVIDAFHARLPAARVAQAYGMTEVSGASHVATRDPARDKPAAGGLLLPNTECVIVDTASGVPLGRNESGEIWVRGPQVMLGYLNQPAATATTIDADGWLHTGDIGYVDEDGFIFIVDRVKELIKYKGLQVAPAELEAILLSHPAVADAAVIPSPDDAAGEVPKAYVVTTTPVPAEELMAFVAERVAPHKRIRRLQFIEAIPKSSAGKILRRTLIEQERGDAPAGSA
jgi:acyl-CoA synthetase (AMP-forming)/AMP-acid ligase II